MDVMIYSIHQLITKEWLYQPLSINLHLTTLNHFFKQFICKKEFRRARYTEPILHNINQINRFVPPYSFFYAKLIYLALFLILIFPQPAVAVKSNNNAVTNHDENRISSKRTLKEPKINVYIDASGSMSGFATKNGDSTTKYAQTLDRIDGCKVHFPGSFINFYKFTRVGAKNPITQLENRHFRQAYKWDFYNGATLIDDVMNSIQVEDLTVIVTDLFQNDSDIGTVIDIVNQKCFPIENRTSVTSIGLIRVSSHFGGTIGQLGSKVAFRHDGILSFYVLVIGIHSDVKKFNSFLIKDLKDEKVEVDLDYILLSPYLMEPLLSFDSVDLSATKNRNNITKVVNVKNSADPPGLEFRVSTRKPETSFSIELPLAKKYNTMLWDNELEVIMSSQKRESGKWVKANIDRKIINVSLNKNVSKSKININKKDIINLKFSLKSSELQKGETYHFVAEVRPKQGSCKLPDWIKNWDMDISKITLWSENPSSYEGTTLNLGLFVKRIWNYIEANYAPSVGVFHLYIKAK